MLYAIYSSCNAMSSLKWLQCALIDVNSYLNVDKNHILTRPLL